MNKVNKQHFLKANSPKELLDLVDENDTVIGTINREIANKDPKLTHREISVLLFDENKSVVIQKRSKYKSVHPNMWSLLAGHIPAGADPEETAYLELEEEFGLTGISLFLLTKKLVIYPHESHFMYYFYGKYSGEKIDFDKSEVSEVKIVSKSELAEMIDSGESFNTKYLPILEKIWSGLHRCTWVPENNSNYQKYHDEEWGVPVFDDTKLFEFLVLEGAQAGLSWETILKRREGYKKAFADWDVQKVAQFGVKDTQRLLADPGIIRNKLKVKSAIMNAQKFLEIQREFGSFSNYIWQFVGGKPIINSWKNVTEYPAQTELSKKISIDLQKRGFTFVGPTIMYAHMQATGMVNDHTLSCFRYNQV